MATKKPVAKKSAVRTSNSKTAAKRKINAKVLYMERHPENHSVTGKFKFFYVFFAVTTLLFALLSVWLFVFSSEVLNRYDRLTSDIQHVKNCETQGEETTE